LSQGRWINPVPALNKIIHARPRLLILSYLASHENKQVSFNELQEKLGFTSGNLSVQLGKLSAAAYVEINKTFKDNKPYTTISITLRGTKALSNYLDEMEALIKALRK
jgi:DNA-binding MarR family transcriptional regulator